jgi:hypothetical protein
MGTQSSLQGINNFRCGDAEQPVVVTKMRENETNQSNNNTDLDDDASPSSSV